MSHPSCTPSNGFCLYRMPRAIGPHPYLSDLADNTSSSSQSYIPSSRISLTRPSSWCHGAPGMLILLSTLLRRLPPSTTNSSPPETSISPALHEKINASITHAASLVYTRGFLRKGVGICHGVGGSVFALLAAANAQPANAEEHLSRAVHLAQLATQYRSLTRRRLMTGPDRPWSLYEGLAGMCCAWAEVVGRVRRGGGVLPGVGCGMPGFDDVV